MKRTKKLLALVMAMVMAMVMAFSLMAVTAAAAGTEESEHVCSTEAIQPKIPAVRCPTCGTQMDAVRVYEEGGKTYIDFECPFGDGAFKKFPW